MRVEKKTIITNVTFTKKEVEMFKNLKKVISECCNAFSDCSRACPFHDWCCIDANTLEELSNFENLEEV